MGESEDMGQWLSGMKVWGLEFKSSVSRVKGQRQVHSESSLGNQLS